jgi:hypothetical protein
LYLKYSFNYTFAQVGPSQLERVEHLAGLRGAELTAGEPGEDHGERVLDGMRVAQRMEDMRTEDLSRADGRGAAGTMQLLVEVAERAVAAGGRLADAAVGLGVAAEWEEGISGVHGIPFGLLQVRPESPSGTTLADTCPCNHYTAAVKGILVQMPTIPGLKIEAWGIRPSLMSYASRKRQWLP